MNIPPFLNQPYENGLRHALDFNNLMGEGSFRERVLFDPELFRMMLDDPAQRESFAARFPTAAPMFEEYLTGIRPAFPEFPEDGITALQLTLFDNGEPQPRPSKAKRPRPRTTPLTMQSRYGLTAKVWNRLDVNWGNERHIAWQANAFLWSAADALVITESLLEKKQIILSTAETLRDYTEDAAPEMLFSIFSQRGQGRGSKWTNIVAVVNMVDDFPQKAGLLVTQRQGYIAKSFDSCTAKGGPLGGKALAQARLALCEKFERWGTEPVSAG